MAEIIRQMCGRVNLEIRSSTVTDTIMSVEFGKSPSLSYPPGLLKLPIRFQLFPSEAVTQSEVSNDRGSELMSISRKRQTGKEGRSQLSRRVMTGAIERISFGKHQVAPERTCRRLWIARLLFCLALLGRFDVPRLDFSRNGFSPSWTSIAWIATTML